MDKKVYLRGMAGTCWYNFTESLAYAATYRPTPGNMNYTGRIHYGSGTHQFINTCCRRDKENRLKPVFIYIHGGGWISGITDMRNTYIQNFARLGFFTASIAYSYAPKAVYPAPLQEVCNAIDFIYDMAEEKKLDMNNILMAGESAGGYYIMFMAALAADKTLAGRLGLTFRHNEEFSINALICHCGCINFRKLLDPGCNQSKFPDMRVMVTSFLGMKYEDAVKFLETEEGYLSYPHIAEGFPPCFFTTAEADWLRFEGWDMMEEYRKLGIPFDSFYGTGILRNHAWTIVTVVPKGKECLEKTLKFTLPFLPDYFGEKK